MCFICTHTVKRLFVFVGVFFQPSDDWEYDGAISTLCYVLFLSILLCPPCSVRSSLDPPVLSQAHVHAIYLCGVYFRCSIKISAE